MRFPPRFALAAALILAAAAPASAQRPPEQLDAAAILHRMRKLEVLGSVLYVAAHPDDENTRLIGSFSNGRRVRTAYLSLTRGDGGQNLIGPELGDALGILRTQELVEARRIDGGEQFFTRAVDFGYSKSAEETLEKWGHDEVLADVVRVVRTFRPDVIVTRFPPDSRGGHGQHTASALLAHEAFDLAADPDAFPEQLDEGLELWQPSRLFFNASSWWNPNIAEEAERDPTRWVVVDVGGYDPLLGASYTELAGRSRSQHKSQGFGAAQTRGEQLEYLQLQKGAELSAPDPLGGVVLGWSRVEGGQRAGELARGLVQSFDPQEPERSLPELAELVRALDELATASAGAWDTGGEAAHWARHHARAARELCLQVSGVVVEAEAGSESVAPGETLAVSLSAIQRRPGPSFELVGFTGPGSETIPVNEALPFNQPHSVSFPLELPAGRAIDQPYWLVEPHGALYRLPDAASSPGTGAGYSGVEPEFRSASTFRATLRLPDGLEVAVDRALMHTWVDRVDGQRTRPVALTPVASIEPLDPVAIVTGEGFDLAVEVAAMRDGLGGELSAALPAGWELERKPAPIENLRRGERKRLVLGLRRGPQAVAGTLRLSFSGTQGASDRTVHVIDYPHILPQTWTTPAEVRLVPLEVELGVDVVGYVEGAGDDVPRALQRLGLAVEHVDPETAEMADLERCDAIVTGIRAYNAVPAMARLHPLLLDYVEAGGTLLVQYTTASRDMVVPPGELGPYPFALTRGRVTVEEAPPIFLEPEHPLLNVPNRLGDADFEGWVQERGLYFAASLDPRYTPLIAWNDPGEEPLEGALVTCDHGAGRFIYTGISLFRQLPAGVPGAYRLLANLLERRKTGE